MASYSWEGFGRVYQMLGRLANPDVESLLNEWEGIIREDNRRGVLAGTDKNGEPMIPVTYRPEQSRGKRATSQQKNNSPRGVFAGLGPHASGLHNNLTSAEYRKLGGPPLAPRGANSRVITNLVTVHTTRPVNGVWWAAGYWDEVVSTTGVLFLEAHFTGASTGRNHATKLPVRDLRGVRSWGQQQALRAARNWGLRLIGTG